MIIGVPPKTLSTVQKNLLTKKGYVVIECADPEKIRVINPEINVDTNHYFMAVLKALTCEHPMDRQEHFVNQLYNRLNAKDGKR